MSTTLNDKIELIKDARDDIKTALYNKTGETQSDDIRTYANKINNIDSTPEGIFIQETEPSTNTDSFWLKVSSEQTVLSDLIPLDKNYGGNRTWRNILQNASQEDLADFNDNTYVLVVQKYFYDSYKYFVSCSKIETNYIDDYYGSWKRVYALYNAKYWCSSGSDYTLQKSDIFTDTRGATGFTADIDFSNVDIYCYTDRAHTNYAIWHQSDVTSTEETGLNIITNGTRYVVYSNKNNANFIKILDTSNANATASDILQGKTAYKNNTKITGTMPNNGVINITPSTEAQTISVGYTSGGTVSAVDNTIDDNIQAENIKSGVSILGVEGTYEGSSEYASLNLFMQEEEPECKDGIWLKTNKTYNKIICDKNVIIEPSVYVSDITQKFSGPIIYDKNDDCIYNLYYNSNYSVSIGKYDFSTDTYTLSSDNISFGYSYSHRIVKHNNDIYIMYGSDSYRNYKYNYKYNITTDTYTKLNDLPISITTSDPLECVGDSIYYLQGNRGFKYNCLEDSYETIYPTFPSSIPDPSFDSGMRSTTDGENIYFITYCNSKNMILKYIVSSNSCEVLCDDLSEFFEPNSTGYYPWGSIIYNDNNLYIIKNGVDSYMKFDLSTNIYTIINLSEPVVISDEKAFIRGNKIFLPNQNNAGNSVICLPNSYEDKSIIIDSKSNDYYTKLIKTSVENGLSTYFYNFYYYTNSIFDITIEKYYGDGTQWIQII